MLETSAPLTDPYWDIEGDRFVLPARLREIRSARGRDIARRIARCGSEAQVFLRGSLLECPHPFDGADIDLLVLYDDAAQLHPLREALADEPSLDVKLFRGSELASDPVQRALLACRALQLCGAPWQPPAITADRDFAWSHWVQYCPATIPMEVNPADRWALVHFKLLVRSFGVLSFLGARRFTRDVTACIEEARAQSEGVGALLADLRARIERGRVGSVRVREVKELLHRRFDEWFPRG